MVADSSGNAGTAVAAYAARAGIPCEIYVPATTSPGKVAQLRAYGAKVHQIPGTREDTAAAAALAAGEPGTFYASHVYHPFYLHGTKTYLPAATQAVNPQPMEMYGQNNGFMLYRRSLSAFTGGSLIANAVHDYATVFIDGKYHGGISRTAVPSGYASQYKVTTGNSVTLPAGTNLDILVEGLGR
jgi:hypothetical protein